MEMDWSKETSGEYEVYPAGTYHLRLVDWERCEANNEKKTKQIRWKFEIQSPDQYKGKPFTDHSALTEAALWRTANIVKGLGVDTAECPVMDTDLPIFEVILNACKERFVYVNLNESTYNGKPKNEVEDYKLDDTQSTIQPEFEAKVEW